MKIPSPVLETTYFKLLRKGRSLGVVSAKQYARLKSDARGFVIFRSATVADGESITNWMGQMRSSGNSSQYIGLLFSSIRGLIVRQTLAATDLGGMLEFDSNGYLLEGDAFLKWWEALPLQWAVMIFAACLKANPVWEKEFDNNGPNFSDSGSE